MAWMRTVALAGVWILFLGALLLLRAHHSGEGAMRRSDAAFHRGDLDRSIDAAREAAGWYFPFAPHVRAAEQRLLAIALGAEGSSDARTALRAWGALRGTLHETAHPGAGRGELRARADQALVRWLSVQPSGSAPGTEMLPLSERFEGRASPDPVFHVATSLGFALLLFAAWTLLRTRELEGVLWGAASLAAGLFLWVFAALGA